MTRSLLGMAVNGCAAGLLAATSLLVVGVPAVAQTAATPAAATPAPASKPLSTSLGVAVFPAKGQTPQKQSQDEGECYA